LKRTQRQHWVLAEKKNVSETRVHFLLRSKHRDPTAIVLSRFFVYDKKNLHNGHKNENISAVAQAARAQETSHSTQATATDEPKHDRYTRGNSLVYEANR